MASTAPAVPLPWLNAIIKPHVRNAAVVRWYILIPLSKVAYTAKGCVGGDASSISPLRRSGFLGLAKDNFISNVYLDPTDTAFKRAMFDIPLEQFFDTCTQVLAGCQIPDGQVRGYLVSWLAACAMHPGAEDGEGEPLPFTLSQYRWIYPNRREFHPDLLTWANQELYAENPRFYGEFPEMQRGLQLVSELSHEYINLALKQFVQFAMNIVQGHIILRGIEGTLQYRSGVARAGVNAAIWAWENMLDNPFSGIPRPLRDCLRAVDPTNLAQSIVGHLRATNRQNEGRRMSSRRLHFWVWLSILHVAKNTPSLSDSPVMKEAIREQRRLNSVVTDNHNRVRTQDIPDFFRPVGVVDEITAELNSRIALLNPGGQTPVPLDAFGPTIQAHTLGQRVSDDVSADERCTICQEDFTDPEEKFVRLNACGHLLHDVCLEALANRLYTNPPSVLCPNCRTRLCAARDYRAVLG
jgi:hypothetical protein